jgi:cytochrome c-type biogenesis protein
MLLGGPLPQTDGVDNSLRRRLVGHTLLFSLGFLTVFVSMGLGATVLGHFLTTYRELLTLFGGLLIFLFGLKLLKMLRLEFLERDMRLGKAFAPGKASAFNSLLMGFVFALGWTPCVGPILGAVLTYTASHSNSMGTGALYLGLYGLGFATPLVLAAVGLGTLLPFFRRMMGWLPQLERGTGFVLAGVGLYVMVSITQSPVAPKATAGAKAPNALTQSLKNKSQPSPALGQPSAKPRMVEFLSSNCPICRRMIPTISALEKECTGGKNGVKVWKIDISRPENKGLAQHFRIRGVPTFVFFNRKGQEVSRLIGFQRLPSLRQSMSLLTGQSCRGVGLLPTAHIAPVQRKEPVARASAVCSEPPRNRAPKTGTTCATDKKGKTGTTCGTGTH